MKLISIGVGYIGLPLTCLFAESGLDTVGISRNEDKVELINSGYPPFNEPGLKELLKTVLGTEKFYASTNFEEEMETANTILICVPTPLSENKTMENTALISVSTQIGANLRKEQLVIVESTISPGTTKNLICKILETKSNLVAGKDFFLAHCPERAIPGNSIYEMKNNNRIIGGIDNKSTEMAVNLYRRIVKGKIVSTDSKTAEVVKLVENSSRDVGIAFVNELALICEKLGVNAFDVISYANLHPRVSLLSPSAGVGGHCLPIDPWFLIEEYPKARLIPTSRFVNDFMPKHVAKTAIAAIKKNRRLSKSKITIFGLSYKPDVDDTREAPSKSIIHNLCKYDIKLVGYDPNIQSCDFISTKDDPVKAADESDCIIISVNHTLFREIDWIRIVKVMRTPIIIDTSNFFKTAPTGFKYHGIGKSKI